MRSHRNCPINRHERLSVGCIKPLVFDGYLFVSDLFGPPYLVRGLKRECCPSAVCMNDGWSTPSTVTDLLSLLVVTRRAYRRDKARTGTLLRFKDYSSGSPSAGRAFWRSPIRVFFGAPVILTDAPIFRFQLCSVAHVGDRSHSAEIIMRNLFLTPWGSEGWRWGDSIGDHIEPFNLPATAISFICALCIKMSQMGHCPNPDTPYHQKKRCNFGIWKR